MPRPPRTRSHSPRPRAPGHAIRRLAPVALLVAAACGPSEAAPGDRGDRSATATTAATTIAATGATSPAGHAGGDPSHNAAHAPTGEAASHRSLDPAEPGGYSIYHAASIWTDQTGTERRLASLAGRVQVVAMVYTSCAYACPRIMLDMKRIEGELADGAEDVGFVIVSIDPERDTPARLAEFAEGSRLDPGRWTLLTADEGDILELAALLGVRYRRTGPGEWVHSNLITVLDPDGVVVHRQLGLGADPTATLAAIRAHGP
ncbi:MAG: hypothetical protein GWM90_30185 [Gemmatimonadetes bacterium]|nr:SCO family protein [Gemmatimonadota bacterium]NIQ59402.1 SCO family protein [Gemmatimonadota bacterium]NIU79590.1 hypothetical protein [Gammaproteobacteria bacterium]NIX48178.1 hypothetical protein [Gemmatimonadota bacterium]NIY12585.1 hypothetical protein [Gemmatimonadota bacterium]